MMNLELLFEASRLSGDSTFYNIARKHADTTMANHFREDNSCYHVVDYDPETGEVRKRQTAQAMPTSLLGHVDKRGPCMAIPCAIAIHTMPNTWNS